MMRILVVEDDDDKAKRLVIHMKDQYILEECVVAKSFQTGLRLALEEQFDLILLDMTMTNYDRTLEDDGGRPHHFAGREILRQLLREDVHVPVIIVTQFDRFGEEAEEITLSELQEDLKDKFPDYVGTVQYRSNVDDWQLQLSHLIGSRIKRLV